MNGELRGGTRLQLTQKFGSYVRQLRRARRLTQESLAEKCDLSSTRYVDSSAEDFSPTLGTLQKLCNGLGVSLAVLFSSFERPRKREELGELIDFMASRNAREVRAVLRVARALPRRCLAHVDAVAAQHVDERA